MSDPRAIIEITADSRALGARLREAGGKLASFAASSSRVVGRVGTSSAAVLYRGAAGAARVFGPALKTGALAVGAGAVIAAGQVRDFEEGLIRLQINADASAEQIDRVRHSVRAASDATGLGSRDILAGVASYVDLTGDFAGATKQVETFARTAQASDTAVGDIAQNAAALQDALQIDPTQMEAAFSALITQGKKGSVTMKELARELPQLAPTMAQFKGGTGLSGLRQLGAAMQVINKRYNSASESATAFQSMAIAIQSRAGRLAKAGVDVFDVAPDGTKRLKDLYSIVDAIGRSDLMKDPTRLIKTLGRSEAIFPLQQLIRLRQVRDEIRAAGEDTGAVERDLKTYQGSKVGKFNKFYNQAKEGAQGLVVDVIEGNIQGATAFGALFSGEWSGIDNQAAAMQSDEGTRRRGALGVMQRYMSKGLVIDPQQAEGINAIETAQQWQDTMAGFGLGPETSQTERENLRAYSMAPQADGSKGGVDAAGNLSTISAAGMEVLFERAMTNALKASGLAGPIKVGADAVLGAGRSAAGHRRRP